MQKYVNVNWQEIMSIVGLIGKPGQGRVVAEGRYIKIPDQPLAELAFVVDESYQNRGISTYLVKMVTKLAKLQGIKAFVFEVLFSNYAMMKVFQKVFKKVETTLEQGIYNVTIPLDDN